MLIRPQHQLRMAGNTTCDHRASPRGYGWEGGAIEKRVAGERRGALPPEHEMGSFLQLLNGQIERRGRADNASSRTCAVGEEHPLGRELGA